MKGLRFPHNGQHGLRTLSVVIAPIQFGDQLFLPGEKLRALGNVALRHRQVFLKHGAIHPPPYDKRRATA